MHGEHHPSHEAQSDASLSHQARDADLYLQVFRATPTALAVVQAHDGTLLDVNAAFARLAGQEAQHLVGTALHDVDAFAEAGLPAWFQRPSQEDLARGAELDLRVRQGDDGREEHRVMLTTAHPLPGREPPCRLVVLSDVTRHKRAEQDLIRAKEEAEETSRVKMAILTNITHEVRTPLTVILGFTSMLREGVREEYQRFVDLVERSGRRLMRMLDTMLDLAQLEAGTLDVECRAFDVGETMYQEAESFREAAEEKGLTFRIHTPQRGFYACTDQRIFTRVLGNLLDNALKFTEEGRIEVALEASSDEVHVCVRDTGIGIDDTFMPKIYDEFVQGSTGLERTHQGNGLGLSVSQRLMEEAGGDIWVESSKGEGSQFTIVLPRHEPPA